VFFAAATGHAFVLTLYLQEGLGFTPLATAVAFLAFPVGVAPGSGVATQLVPRLGRRLVTGGGVVMALGFVLLIAAVHRYGTSLQGWQLTPGLIVAGLGMSMVAATLLTIVLSRVPGHAAGSASGVVNTTVQLGIAAGVALIGTVFLSLLDDRVGVAGATGVEPLAGGRAAARQRRGQLPAAARAGPSSPPSRGGRGGAADGRLTGRAKERAFAAAARRRG
jgi:MFS family permease